MAQPLLIESAPLPVHSILSVVKPALSFQTVGPGLLALPLVEPVPLASPVSIPCALAALQFTLPTFGSVLPATIESNPSTLSIMQEASEMQVRTEQNVEEKEAVYNQECFWSVAGIFTTNEASLSGSLMMSSTGFSFSSTEVPLTFSPILLDVFVLLARLFVGFLDASRVMRCPVHISRFVKLGES